ncbi:sensor histidine kinase [Tepidamorphus sp. 3E244]|uniref:sensor histidine kinase n=1 Tax=Tepidamorphus sp. 3E244 TaxID=3385498 RepID=UPI0038FCDF81
MRLREIRAKLSSNTGFLPAFDRELLATYVKNQLSIAPLTMALTIVLAVGASTFSSLPHVAYWTVGMLLASAISLVICRRFERATIPDKQLNMWRQRFVALEFFVGAFWSTLIFTPVTDVNALATVFPLAVGLILLAMRTVAASNMPAAVLAGTLPITAAVLASYAQFGGSMAPVMGGIAIGAQALFSMMAFQLYRAEIAKLAFRAEKDAIFGELEQAKAISDEARRRAEQNNLAKSRFLATMSHELRTPLNAILGFSEVLKDEIMGPHQVDAYKEYATDIHKSGQHLLNLINEILDLSRIEAGRHELQEEAVLAVGIVQDCARLLAHRAKEKGMTLNEHYAPDLPRLWADERSLRQVTLNLINNAIKFTPAGGTIDITVGWTSGGGQYISVRDNGPGIPEQEIPTVLQAFGRGSAAHKAAEEGSGLGLPIVVGLVERHGGRFSIKSKLREGTEVIATFPKERVMTAMPAVSKRQAEQPPMPSAQPKEKISLRKKSTEDGHGGGMREAG